MASHDTEAQVTISTLLWYWSPRKIDIERSTIGPGRMLHTSTPYCLPMTRCIFENSCSSILQDSDIKSLSRRQKKIAQAGRRNFAWMRGGPPDTVPPSPWMVQTGGLNLSIYLSLLTDFCHRFRTIHTIPFSLRLQYCTKVSSSPIMYLTKFFALFIASIPAVAPSIEYSQLSVKVTGTATQNRGSVEHFSQDWIQMVESRCSIYHSTSPWERTLSFRVGALQVSWPTLRVSAPRRLSRHKVGEDDSWSSFCSRPSPCINLPSMAFIVTLGEIFANIRSRRPPWNIRMEAALLSRLCGSE